jgi:hypothetical protein
MIFPRVRVAYNFWGFFHDYEVFLNAIDMARLNMYKFLGEIEKILLLGCITDDVKFWRNSQFYEGIIYGDIIEYVAYRNTR